MNRNHTTAAGRYNELSSWRSGILATGRACAKLTLPYLLPPSGHSRSNNDILPQPWQSVGARGVNIMASKLLVSSLPTNTSFFKLQVDDGEFVRNEDLDRQIRSEVDEAMAQMERIINQDIDASNDRQAFVQAFRHLVCTGNYLLFAQDDGPMQGFPLDRYVIERDGTGRWTEIITVEAIDRFLLPEEFHTGKDPTEQDFKTGKGTSHALDGVTAEENEVLVFTYVLNDGEDINWYQEAEGQTIPGTEGHSKSEESPWYPLRFNVVDGEDYGRGRIEEYYGDLQSLDALTKLIVEGGSSIAKTVWLVSPSAMVSAAQVAEAPNNAVLPGREGDVVCVKADKGGDFQVVLSQAQAFEKRLNEAFLIFSPRQSERTTAEEIRAMQQELAEQLGGQLVTIQTDGLQPFLRRKMAVLQKKKKLPKLPEGIILPTVVTGLSAIGRGQDTQALMLFSQTGQQAVGEQFGQLTHALEFLKRLATGMGIDPLNLIKSSEEMQQEQEAAQQSARQDAIVQQAGQFAQAESRIQQEQMRNAQNAQEQAPGAPAGGPPGAPGPGGPEGPQ